MKKKLSLSNTEKQEHNANAKRLMAAGVIRNEDKPSSEPQMLTVEQTGGLSESLSSRCRSVVTSLSFGCASSR